MSTTGRTCGYKRRLLGATILSAVKSALAAAGERDPEKKGTDTMMWLKEPSILMVMS